MASNNDTLNTNVQLDTNPNGTVSFATDVVATIAGVAATEVEGVAAMGASSAGLAEIFTRRNQVSAKNATRGVKIELNGEQVTVTVTIIVDYGTPVPDVARGIQENVKKAIETMTGLKCAAVHVHVQGVSFERENRTTAEIEEKQKLMLSRKPAEKAEPAAPTEPAAEPEPEKPAEPEAEAEDDEGEYELELEDVPEDELEAELQAEMEAEQPPADE